MWSVGCHTSHPMLLSSGKIKVPAAVPSARGEGSVGNTLVHVPFGAFTSWPLLGQNDLCAVDTMFCWINIRISHSKFEMDYFPIS